MDVERTGVLFDAAGTRFCIDSSELSLIRKIDEGEITPLPSEMAKVRGLMNISGRPIILLDPFGCEGAEVCMVVTESEGDFAFLVDSVIRVTALPCEDGVNITAGEILERMK